MRIKRKKISTLIDRLLAIMLFLIIYYFIQVNFLVLRCGHATTEVTAHHGVWCIQRIYSTNEIFILAFCKQYHYLHVLLKKKLYLIIFFFCFVCFVPDSIGRGHVLPRPSSCVCVYVCDFEHGHAGWEKQEILHRVCGVYM